MSQKIRFQLFAVCAAALLSVSLGRDASDSYWGGEFGGKVAVAQDGQNSRRSNRQNGQNNDRQGGWQNNNRQGGGQNNNRQGGWQNNNRQGGGQNNNRQGGGQNNNRQGGGRSPEEIVSSMTPERFEQLKSTPFAGRVRQMVGEVRWSQWERGEFTEGNEAAEAAAKAAAAEKGELVELEEMTDEEKAAAEALLTAGTVPKFHGENDKPYSIESEDEYYRRALARRDDSLVPAAPVALRFYGRYLLAKYDDNGNGVLEQPEWEGKLVGAQGVDLNGDLTLDDQEILFYLVRFSKGRTIFNPEPPRRPIRSNVVVAEKEADVLIRPASGKYERATDKEAAGSAANVAAPGDELADMTQEEIHSELTSDNPALERVDDEELLGVLLSDMDSSSVREYAAAPETLLGVPVWFLARDANGDGQLSLREFAPNLSSRALAYFGKLDANADGFVTADEVRENVASANAQ